MDYRREWKHIISFSDMLMLRQRLKAVMKADEHAEDGKYLIRSLYFDTPTDVALREKLDGVSRREKFRIRCYNNQTELINLEKKSKISGVGNKMKARLTAEETQKIIDGDIEWMSRSDDALILELYSKMNTQQLRPTTIVDYTREPYTYAPGNVRVTLDYDLRTGLDCTDFLNPDCMTVPAAEGIIILEVKWDEFLPDVIRGAVQLGSRKTTEFSKYAQCRIYG